MIFADKLISLRKKNGWSQEELAEKLGVSRQAVSKWESAQTVPDLDKILTMARLFGVSTDYLLKDEIEQEEHVGDGEEPDAKRVPKISLAFAQEYLALRTNAAKRIASGVALCILAAVPLILLSGASEDTVQPAPVVIGLGVVLMFVMLAAAVAMLVHCGFVNAPYEFLDKGEFEVEYGVEGLVRDKQKAYRPVYGKVNMIGVVLCILSPVPLVAGAFMMLDGFVMVCLTCLLLATVAVAVYLFVRVGTVWGAMQRLLREGDFEKKKEEQSKLQEAISGAYWCIVTASYLLWSFLSGDWNITWVVWPVAGVLFGAIEAVMGYKEKDQDSQL